MASEGGRRVAITGVSGHWGSEIARRLARDPRVSYVVGIDTRAPSGDLGDVDFIEADLRGALISRLLPSTEVDTVVHCGILWYPEPGKPARSLHDFNVIGTLQLLAACERTPTLERVVVRGSAAIYGCEGAAPLFFPEDLAGEMPLRTRFQRDVSELEGYFENFARRHPQISSCMLRFQPEIGADLDTPLVRYLSLPVVPTQLGYRPAASAPGRRGRDRRPGSSGVERHPRARSTSRPRAPFRSAGSSGWAAGRRCRSRIRSSARASSASALGSVPALWSATRCACSGSAAASTTAGCAGSSALSPG